MTDFMKADSCVPVWRALRVVSMLLAADDRILVDAGSAMGRCHVASWFHMRELCSVLYSVYRYLHSLSFVAVLCVASAPV